MVVLFLLFLFYCWKKNSISVLHCVTVAASGFTQCAKIQLINYLVHGTNCSIQFQFVWKWWRCSFSGLALFFSGYYDTNAQFVVAELVVQNKHSSGQRSRFIVFKWRENDNDDDDDDDNNNNYNNNNDDVNVREKRQKSILDTIFVLKNNHHICHLYNIKKKIVKRWEVKQWEIEYWYGSHLWEMHIQQWDGINI